MNTLPLPVVNILKTFYHDPHFMGDDVHQVIHRLRHYNEDRIEMGLPSFTDVLHNPIVDGWLTSHLLNKIQIYEPVQMFSLILRQMCVTPMLIPVKEDKVLIVACDEKTESAVLSLRSLNRDTLSLDETWSSYVPYDGVFLKLIYDRLNDK